MSVNSSVKANECCLFTSNFFCLCFDKDLISCLKVQLIASTFALPKHEREKEGEGRQRNDLSSSLSFSMAEIA